MSRSVYNLMWADAPPGLDPELCYEVGLVGENCFDDLLPVRGVILFPCLGTPLLYFEGVDEPWIELIIATEGALTPEHVNHQLKLCPGLDPNKPCEGLPLFGGAYAGGEGLPGNILVEPADGRVLRTHGRFRGVLHDAFRRHLNRLGLTSIHRVRLSASALDRPDESDPFSFSLSETGERFLGYRGARTGPALVGQETHDEIIRAVLDDRVGPESAQGTPLAGRGRYCFKRTRSDVDVASADAARPIQSYHPLFVYHGEDARAELALGFASDIHINVRCGILGRSTARVIEYADADAHEGESPRVGTLLKETNRSFASVLDELCALNPTAVILGGDFIDHVRNAYAPGLLMQKAPTPAEVWAAVAMGGQYTKGRYPGYVDFTAFYTLIFDAMVRHAMPFFVVSGNHDAYPDAFGISPRVSRMRTNETIPADLNLTMYEAILAFGPHAGAVPLPGAGTFFDPPGSLGPTFEAEWFDWVYTVLTPFTDYGEALPQCSLVGLGWGDDESMASVPPKGQGFGYLGRAASSISAVQMSVINGAVGWGRPVTLATHFTFVSYGGELLTSAQGRKDLAKEPVFSEYEMGTFEQGAKEVIPKLATGAINCVLSGHSHRRAVYFLHGQAVGNVQSILGLDVPSDGIPDLDAATEGAKAVMIVSDSAGPYPKRNVRGEFHGYGMDIPSGTLVRYRGGRPRSVEPVFASRPPPRAVVALDFLDLTRGEIFVPAPDIASLEWSEVTTGESEEELDVGMSPEFLGHELRMTVTLSGVTTTTWGVQVDGVRLVRWASGAAPERIALQRSQGTGPWRAFLATREEPIDLAAWLSSDDARWFVSLELSSSVTEIQASYDWSSAWNIEVEPRVDPRRMSATLRRPMRVLKGLGLTPWQEVVASATFPKTSVLVAPFAREDQVWAEVPDFDRGARHA
ncbi:MAG: metallophosphoesterase [Polyangiales bacterium]